MLRAVSVIRNYWAAKSHNYSVGATGHANQLELTSPVICKITTKLYRPSVSGQTTNRNVPQLMANMIMVKVPFPETLLLNNLPNDRLCPNNIDYIFHKNQLLVTFFS